MSETANPSPLAELSLSPGQWVAWDKHQEHVLAAADTYPEMMARISELGLGDPVVEKAPGIHPLVAAKEFTLLPNESSDIIDDVRMTIPDPDLWLDTPNTRLWCEKPRDLIGTEQERQLRYLLRGIRSGITS